MPVSVSCDSAGVMTAIRSGLSSPLSNVNYSSSNDTSQAIQNRLIASAKRVLFTKIEYEETCGYNESILDILKSKYIILKPNQSGRINLTSDKDETVKENNPNQFCFGVPAPKDSNQLPKPKKVLYPRNLVQIGWHSSGRKWQVGAGMINVGNTCYLNSTLQAVFHVPAMANWLMSDAAHREKCENEDGSSGGCIICAMSKTLIASQTNQSPIRPYLVYTKLRLVCKHLIMGRQEDAHEFLRYLVEAMEKSYLSRIPNSKEFEQYSKETTPLNQILGGYLKSAVRCLSCGHVSTTFQHFQDILLDIRKANSIEEALDLYFARERLEDMGYKCEACKKKVSATKQFSLERAPISLCIQLKRFSMMGSKLNKHVTIRPRLDLSPYAGKKCKENLSYKLVAMVTHLGASQHCGHYTAIGLTDSGAYYQFDDSYVRPISLQNVVNTNAYIIFYELDDSKDQNRQSCSMVSREQTNLFKHAPSKTDITSNGNENNFQKQNSPAATNNKMESDKPLNTKADSVLGPKSSNDFGEALQKIDGVNSNKLAISNGSKSSPASVKNDDKLYKKPFAPSSANSAKDLVFNSPSSSSSIPSFNRVIQFEKPSSSSTKVASSTINGITEDRLPSGLWSPKKYSGSEQISPRKGSPLNVAKNNGSSTSNIHEYLHNSSSSHEVVHQNKAECSKSNNRGELNNFWQSLVPYDSDDESETCGEEFAKPDKVSVNSVTIMNSKNNENSDNMSNSSSYFSNDYRPPPSKVPRNIPSPPIMKTKAGLWKVSDITEEQSKKDDNNNNSFNGKNASKNPFSSGNSELSGHLKSKDFYNGKDQQTYNKSNGRNDTEKQTKEANILHHLLKSSHQDVRRPVLTWWGQKSNSDKQAMNQSKPDRKRDMYDEEDEMMEAGRQKKRKSNNSGHISNPGYNPFQEYQNNGGHQRRWNNNNSYRRFRPNNNHRNNNFHRQGYNKKRGHRQRNHLDMNGYRHRRNN